VEGSRGTGPVPPHAGVGDRGSSLGLVKRQLAKESPGYFAAIGPLAGGTNPEWAPMLAHQRSGCFRVRRMTSSRCQCRNMVEALRTEGGGPRFTLLPDMDQGVGPSVWSRRDPYDWLLEHRLPVKPGEK